MPQSLAEAQKGLLERIRAPVDTRKPWREVARPEQVRPEGCDTFIIRGGRSSGKTRGAAEDCLERVRSGDTARIHVLAPTFGDARDICIEGESGIKACALPGEISNWNRSMGEMYFSNGVYLKIFGAEEPDRLNGPQCFIAGTLVATPNGDVPIERLRAGSLVLTRKGPHRVTATSTRSATVGRVEFDNGRELIGTADHPVFTSGDWLQMGRLSVGNTVCAIRGSATIAVSVASTWQRVAERDVYCLAVEGEHEYFANGILVHNCGHLWCDEFWTCGIEAIDQAEFGLRIGKRVTSCWSSTPKASKSTKYVLAQTGAVIRRLSLLDNAVNLAPGVVERWLSKYKGTRLEKVEIEGELLEDIPGALWSAGLIEPYRVNVLPPDITMIVIGVDPSVSDPEKKKNPNKDPDECGIVAFAVSSALHGYVLEDLSDILSPNEWAQVSVQAYSKLRANIIVAEGNQGGELVRMAIQAVGPNVPVVIVHASMNKRARAEPLALLYEQGRVHHVGSFPALEEQMTTWDHSLPGQASPGRIDALVWAAYGSGILETLAGGVAERFPAQTEAPVPDFVLPHGPEFNPYEEQREAVKNPFEHLGWK
jgi:phage terminase large subunit-like protein